MYYSVPYLLKITWIIGGGLLNKFSSQGSYLGSNCLYTLSQSKKGVGTPKVVKWIMNISWNSSESYNQIISTMLPFTIRSIMWQSCAKCSNNILKPYRDRSNAHLNTVHTCFCTPAVQAMNTHFLETQATVVFDPALKKLRFGQEPKSQSSSLRLCEKSICNLYLAFLSCVVCC